VNSLEFAGNALRRAGVRLGVLVVVLAAVGVVGLIGVGTVMWVSGLTSTPTAGCGYQGGTSPLAVGPGAGAGPNGRPTDEQRQNAAIIVGVGQQLQVPERGQWIALATALQESNLRNINYGDRDSLGLFQQRPSQGWGSPQEILDPVYSATQFYTRLLEVPDWPQMELWQAAQAVQRSAFPTAYSKWENLAATLLAEGGTDVSLLSTDVCAPRGGPLGPAALAYTGPATGCVVDDPTSSGCLTATTAHGLEEITRVFGGHGAGSRLQAVGCWDAHAWNPSSDHPKGRACDIFPGSAGVFAAGDELQAGWELAEWLRANAEQLQVSYIIWQGRIWSTGGGDTDGGWGQPYNGGGVYDPDEATGGHFDHVHVSFRS
jgi:hypothetical protein